jgi:hypothetical protein
MAKENETLELLKQISAKLDELNGTIKKIDEENEKREKATRKEDNELQLKGTKIQIYSDRCHAVLSARLSLVFVIFGLLVIFYPFYIQATLEGNPFSTTGIIGLSGTLLVTGVAGFYLREFTRKYNNDIKRISDMIESLKKSGDFPSLAEMDKKK